MASAYVTGSSDILPARTANGCDIKATQLIKTDSAPFALAQSGSAAAAVQYLAEVLSDRFAETLGNPRESSNPLV
jgi:hypothetical protein